MALIIRKDHPPSAVTQTHSLYSHAGDGLLHPQWAIDVDSYLKGKKSLDHMLYWLMHADNKLPYVQVLLRHLECYRGADVLDPAIDLLRRTPGIAKMALRASSISDDAWYVLAQSIAQSEHVLSQEKFATLKALTHADNVEMRHSAITALATLAHADADLLDRIVSHLQWITENDTEQSVRDEAKEHITDLER